MSNGTNGDEDRGQDGRFLPNNKAAKGRGGRHKVALLREAALEAASPDMARDAMRRLFEIGMEGDVRALCEWLNRCGVKPEMIDLEERLGELESALQEAVSSGGLR